MRIVFMGTPAAAAVSLRRLIADGHEIAAVYSQPDRPAGRGNRILSSPVKEAAIAAGLEIFQPVKLKTDDAADLFRSHRADVAVVVAYGRILPKSFLEAFQGGAINVHFSLLPKYRGAAPVNWAIANGETETGVTTMKMDEGLDTGDILLQSVTSIGRAENAIELMDRLSHAGAELLSSTLEDLDSIVPRRQKHIDATNAPILAKADGQIDWKWPADKIAARVRGFQPFPTTFTFTGGKRLTIWSATAVDGDEPVAPGTITRCSGGELHVACGEQSSIDILEIQLEGKRRMSARDFINGMSPEKGTVLT